MSHWDRPLSSNERQLFGQFLLNLERVGVVAVLLRNYETFPATMGHDLDVFFRREDLPKAVKIFRTVLQKAGGEVLQIHERDYVLAVWFRAAPGEPKTIHLDFYHGAYTWHGLTFLSDAAVIAGARQQGDFKIPRPAHEALSLFLASLMWGAFYKSRYGERIESLLSDPEESVEFFRLLEDKFGPDSRPAFAFTGENLPDKAAARAYAVRLRSCLQRRSFARQPFRSLFLSARYWWGEMKTVLSPPAICIAVLGPDGSGKSTVIHAVKARVEYFFGETVDRHWRPQLLRDAGVAARQRSERTGSVTDPHGRQPHSMPLSALRFFYYWLDYWLGWPLRVWKFKAKNHLVIFDRYAPDMWCDPRRYRLNLPTSLMKCFCRLVPQPELTFVLLADAETIHQRKGEVPLETVRELLLRYGDAAQQGRRIRAVDCRRTVDQIADEIAAAIMAVLKAKTNQHRRFR